MIRETRRLVKRPGTGWEHAEYQAIVNTLTMHPSDYHEDKDIVRMFGHPRYVIKAGEIVVEEGEIRKVAEGRSFLGKRQYRLDDFFDVEGERTAEACRGCRTAPL